MAFQTWILLAAVIGVTCGEENPSVDIKVLPAGELTQGMEVKVQCDVRGTIDPRRAAFYLQRIANGITSRVSSFQSVATDFQDQNRFTVDYVGEATHMMFAVTVDGILGSDSGTYKCVFTQGGTPYTAEQDIRVLVPVKSVQIVQVTNVSTVPIEEGMDVDLEYSRHVGVGCLVKVEGTLAFPSVTIDTNSEIQFDLVTDEKEEEVINSQWVARREILYQYRQQEPSLQLHGKTISCVAFLSGFPEKEATAVVKVYTLPEVTCDATHSAEISDAVTLRCEVKSSPMPDLDKTAWSWKSKGGNRTSLSMDDSIPRYTSKLEDLGNNMDYLASLKIENVQIPDFVNYRLEVVNDQGKLRTPIQLIEVVTTTTTTTVATTTTTTIPVKETTQGKGGSSENVIGPGGSATSSVYSLMLTLAALMMAVCLS